MAILFMVRMKLWFPARGTMVGPDFVGGDLDYGPFLNEEEFMTYFQIKQ